jgi:hypothetical protein
MRLPIYISNYDHETTTGIGFLGPDPETPEVTLIGQSMPKTITVAWCSRLSRVLHTDKVASSSLAAIIFFA